MLRFENTKLELTSTIRLLADFDTVFTPRISNQVDVDSYAKKLSTNGHFILAISTDDNSIEGFITYYLNTEGHFAYVPFIGVKPSCQHGGVGRCMIEELISVLSIDYTSIMLEVRKSNTKAHDFYLRNGFVEKEDRINKWLMSKEINNR